MEIIVFAKKFRAGNWEVWEHTCSEEEVDAVEDSARAKAVDRFSFEPPLAVDYLGGARYIFDVARGESDNPRDGDTCVHGVSVDGVLIGVSEELSRYNRQSDKVA
ncbi:MAG: hypothetical protein WCF30_00085 [Terracidiphilus sp.]